MPSTSDFRDIYEYNWRVLRDYCDALAKLPEDELLKNREATHESLKNIFHHILSVHDGWLNVTAQGASADPAMREKDFDEVRTMEPLRAYMEKIIAKEKRFLAKLTEKDLDRGVQPEWKTRPHPLRDALMQVTFEQAHHTGELIALFWQIDVEPPEMTWIDVRLLMKGNVGRRRASEIKGGVDSMEDAGPHSRGRTRLQKNPRTRGGGTHLPAGAGSIVPPGPSGQTGNSPECLLQVAGASLGPRQPRRPRLPAGRRDPLPDSGPHPGILAQAELLPRVRGADVRRGVSAPGCPYHAGSLSSLCVPAGKRALLPYRPWDRG